MIISPKFFFFFSLFFAIQTANADDQLKLTENGKTDYKIFISGSSHAGQDSLPAVEFREYIYKISKTYIPFSKKFTSKGKFIIFEINLSADTSFKLSSLNDDGFRIHTNGQNLYFTAKTTEGLQNAVYSFLEKYLGCRYYSEDCVIIPPKKDIILNKINDIQNPPFIFRTIHYGEAYKPGYKKWHKLNNTTKDSISGDWGLWVHTLHKLVPPEKYFTDHPEYYAYRNGIRMKDQLCLSNPDVLAITVESLRQLMLKNPDAKYWSVSQMDNYNFCQCDKCRMVDSIEGSHSGSLINFVNMVAAQFPDKVISTLAYQYSRKAPRYARPTSNVNIMLCSIESDRSRPIESDTSEENFFRDMKDWSSITSNIFIWDYVINFSHVVMPFPDFHVLQSNIRLFAKYHANMIFEQGYAGTGAEFEEFRCYLLSKLLWDPNINFDSTMNDFLDGYYGASAGNIRDYIGITTSSLVKSAKALTIYEPPALHSKDYLSPQLIANYFSIFNKALAMTANDSASNHRVIMAFQPVRYAWLEVCKYELFTDNWIFDKAGAGKYKPDEFAVKTLEDFYRTAKQYGPSLLNENSMTPDEYYSGMKDYFLNGTVNHLAVGKKIRFEKPYSDQYHANGPGSLIDGVRGTNDYQMLWQGWWGSDIIATIDLESIQTIKAMEVNCLDNNQKWIMAPQSIRIETSTDGKIFTPAIFYKNPDAGKNINPQIVKFSIPLKQVFNARFLKVTLKNIGKLPAWRGVDGNAWLFVDEIVVK